MKMGTTGGKSISVGNRNLNPPQWVDFDWEDPKHGHQAKGEVTVIRAEGTSGELAAGLWRTGHEIVGCEADGSCTIRYSAPLGDETLVLLEGQAHLLNEETGEEYVLQAGDIVGLPEGLPVKWTSKGPFLKKFSVFTRG